MKHTVTTSSVFKYILVFTFIFAAFLALAITYNRVYKLKNQSISIIEKYEGIVKGKKSLGLVNNYLKNSGYNIKGECLTGEYGVIDLDNPNYEIAKKNEKYYYCLSDKVVKNVNGDKIYYSIKLFFKFNLPFIGELFTFKITGETKEIYYYDKNQRLS